jgi:hypothetical protein
LQQKDRLFVQLFSKFLKQRVPFEIRALDKHNAVIFTDGPCGLAGVFFFQNEMQFFSLELDEIQEKTGNF